MIIGDSLTTKKIDKYSINNLGIPGIVLMENAAVKILNHLDLNKNECFLIVAGKGNNGGDAFALARHLLTYGKKIEVFLVGGEKGLSKDCYMNYNILKNLDVNINLIETMDDIEELRSSIKKSDMVIEGIFGTGLTRKVEGIYDSVISIINENSDYTVSIDVPSGLNCNTGEVLGNCIIAKRTITLMTYKRGFLNYNADNYIGEIIVENIGVPYNSVKNMSNNEFILQEEYVRKNLKIRNKYGHKGDYGRALVVAGSQGFTGAAYLCTEATVKSGAGLVTLATHENIGHILSCKLNEAMTSSVEDKIRFYELLKNSNSVAIGPGLGNNDDTLQLLKEVIERSNCPIVIDADGINCLKGNLQLIKNTKNPIILTPHPGEMSRLTGMSIKDINKNRIDIAKGFARENQVIILLKGYNTVITDGYKTFVNSTGNSAMASGGMGDILTGIIASFLAQGYKPLESASIAAFLHGYCGDKLSQNMHSVSASEVLRIFPYVMKNF
ncbi:NAD(P)H-hydrate dehydratase [Clostridium cochlearium]|uniref:Bifunctional NAD(P)H-hydrate repair enzyme n=1 Tax=Clostridium cochlearium TaxID=1494 RepID=A0A7Y3V7E2_CLOCO|nr:NAD(P)H-hydrate dehydratase [Clostridium cochlearium]NOH15164.1 NAD(P)H-hydrate dehydratase [Clostridium cochlearium]